MRQAHADALVGIQGKGIPVENQFILSTDKIAIDSGNAGRLNPVGQNLDPLARLVEVAGRGVENEQQFGASLAGKFGSAFFPNIGTDIDTAAHAIQRDDAGFGALLEVALLVEDFVVWQAHLAIGRGALAVFDDSSRVVAGTVVFFRIPDDHGNAVDAGSQVVESPVAGPVEIRAQQQVFRRIAAQRQLRRQQHMSAAGLGLGGALDDAFDVARQITDGGVELGNGDTQHETQ